MMHKMNYGKVFLLGFGFLGISLLWAVYNAYVPIFLQAGNPNLPLTDAARAVSGFGLPAVVTGFIMSLDNIAAVFIQPWIGVQSDRTRTRFGRRIPYILVGAPITVAGFIAIPFAVRLIPPELSGQLSRLTVPFALLMGALVVTLLAAAIYRTPAIALMPDIVPSRFRSQANGIINLMGGLGVVIGLFAGGWLFDRDITLPFVVGGVLVLVSSAIVVAFIKEPPAAHQPPPEAQPGLLDNLRHVWRDEDRSVFNLLLAIFAWFLAYNALETFFTSYATFELGVTTGRASQLFTIAGGVFILFAVPAGYIAGRIGRKRTILGGLGGFVLGVVMILLLNNLTVVIVALVIVGASWALVNINSLPMVVDSVSQEQLGAYTGLYYFASMSAAIIGPIAIGQVIDWLGYPAMFLASAVALGTAAWLLSRVTRGEALPEAPAPLPAANSE
ncbi:MAG: MFS transporter [Caldilineae bacterium]|nr:MAG: MFS transporter [Caldilineae bacterium]